MVRIFSFNYTHMYLDEVRLSSPLREIRFSISQDTLKILLVFNNTTEKTHYNNESKDLLNTLLAHLNLLHPTPNGKTADLLTVSIYSMI